jgi:hypothetical protein
MIARPCLRGEGLQHGGECCCVPTARLCIMALEAFGANSSVTSPSTPPATTNPPEYQKDPNPKRNRPNRRFSLFPISREITWWVV